MYKLESLLEGITLLPEVSESKALTPEEASEFYGNRFRIIEEALDKLGPQIFLINQRMDALLSEYDSKVLKGYSEERDLTYAKERKDDCIMCFGSYPKDQSAWVRINWGINSVGLSEETQIKNLRNEALSLQGQEAERFFYSLRAYLLEDLEKISRNYSILMGQPLRSLPESGENEELSSEEEQMVGLAGEKENLWKIMGNAVTRYQIMVQLTQAKSR